MGKGGKGRGAKKDRGEVKPGTTVVPGSYSPRSFFTPVVLHPGPYSSRPLGFSAANWAAKLVMSTGSMPGASGFPSTRCRLMRALS